MSASTGKAVGAGTVVWMTAALIFAAVLCFSAGGEDAGESPVRTPGPSVICLSLDSTPGITDTEQVACS